VLAGRALQAPPVVLAAVAAAAVLGHMYSPFLRFGGGKGVATAAGALGALAPLALALSLVAFVAVVAWKRYISLGSIVAVALFPLFVLLGLAMRGGGVRGETPFLLASTLVPLFIIWKHRGNLRRLRAGSERRIGSGREEGT
jgi:glycerol-3-phosphate acyltransferase PlsY